MSPPLRPKDLARMHARLSLDRQDRISEALQRCRSTPNIYLQELRREQKRRWSFVHRVLGDSQSPAHDVELPAAPSPGRPPLRIASWAGLRFVALGLIIVGVLFFMFGWLLLEPLSRHLVARWESPAVERAEAAVRCADSLLVRDRHGVMMGALRRHQDPSCYGSHLTVPFTDDAAIKVAEAFSTLEGRYRRWSLLPTFYGHDLVGLCRAALHVFDRRRLGFTREQIRRGEKKAFFPPAGSPSMLTAFESLSGNPHPQESVRDKLAYLTASAIYDARHLRGSDILRAKHLAEHLPALDVRGMSIAGRLASEHLFGEAAKSTLAEQCLFAAFLGFPLREPFAGASADWQASVPERLARAKARASSGCAMKLARSPEELAEARREIEAFQLPSHPFPRISAATFVLLDDPLLIPRSAGHDIRLTLDGALQAQVEPRVREAAEYLSAGQARPDYIVAVGEIQDDGSVELRLVVASRRGLLGDLHQSKDHFGRPVLPEVGLASQAKVALTLLGAQKYTALCNRRVGNISNASGPPPVAQCLPNGFGFVDIRTAIALSMNLPFASLAEDHPHEVRALQDALDWRGEDLGPAVALGIGRSPSPLQMLSLMGALDQSRYGRPIKSPGLSIVQGQFGNPIDLSALGYTAEHGAAAADILSAPLRPGGTLHGLRQDLDDLPGELAWGKSGSPEIAAGKLAMARSASVIFECAGGGRFAVLALLSSGSNTLPVQASTRDLALLIRPALEAMSLSHCTARPPATPSPHQLETFHEQ